MSSTVSASAMCVIVERVIVLRLLRSIARASGVVSMSRGIFVIVLARCAAVARRIVVCKDSGHMIIQISVCFKVIL